MLVIVAARFNYCRAALSHWGWCCRQGFTMLEGLCLWFPIVVLHFSLCKHFYEPESNSKTFCKLCLFVCFQMKKKTLLFNRGTVFQWKNLGDKNRWHKILKRLNATISEIILKNLAYHSSASNVSFFSKNVHINVNVQVFFLGLYLDA